VFVVSLSLIESAFVHMSCVGLLKLPSNELCFGLILIEMVSHQYFLGFRLKYIRLLVLKSPILPQLCNFQNSLMFRFLLGMCKAQYFQNRLPGGLSE